MKIYYRFMNSRLKCCLVFFSQTIHWFSFHRWALVPYLFSWKNELYPNEIMIVKNVTLCIALSDRFRSVLLTFIQCSTPHSMQDWLVCINHKEIWWDALDRMATTPKHNKLPFSESRIFRYFCAEWCGYILKQAQNNNICSRFYSQPNDI